ncbi:MAG: hypothetical protein KAQ85_03850 [Thermodesulfovibrionia bacterium]|nr:hypothetical protein [Thermodesulfovibrionia bacterium]
MPVKKIFFLFLSIVLFCITAEGSQNIITLNYPPDKTIMDLDLLSISTSIPQGSADLVKVSVNNEEKVRFIPSREFECFSVFLVPGVNRIDITAIKKDKQIDKLTLHVFRRSALVSEYKDAPSDYRKDYFHMEDRSQCSACHILEWRDTDKRSIDMATFSDEVLEKDKEAATISSTCYSCHKGITSYPYVHGPASVWSCLTCHVPDAKPKYSVKKPDTEVCFNCHLEQKQDWTARKYIHGPVNTGNCAICHSPHASQYSFNLVEPTWDLCVSCHAGKETGRHIIAGYVYSDSHPTRGKPEPLRKGKELSCASCHNPHASDYPRLWALNARSAFVLCQKCHQK